MSKAPYALLESPYALRTKRIEIGNDTRLKFHASSKGIGFG